MKIKLIPQTTLILALLILLSGCQNNTSETKVGEGAGLPVEPAAEALMTKARDPKLGEQKRIEYLTSEKTNEQTCRYYVFEVVRVEKVAGVDMDLKFLREFQKFDSNSTECTAAPRELKAEEVRTFDVRRYRRAKLMEARKASHPAALQESSADWMKSAKRVSNREINHKGLRTLETEFEVLGANGVNYKVLTRIALDQIFLSFYEYERRRADSNLLVNYFTLLEYKETSSSPTPER